jgi:hypothetical protein
MHRTNTLEAAPWEAFGGCAGGTTLDRDFMARGHTLPPNGG